MCSGVLCLDRHREPFVSYGHLSPDKETDFGRTSKRKPLITERWARYTRCKGICKQKLVA